MPTIPQLALLLIAIVLFAIGGGMSIARAWGDNAALRLAAVGCLVAGIVCSAIVLVWHGSTRGGWIPIGDNFDALVWLATLLALFILYIQRHRRLGVLDWFVMPIVILLLGGAIIFGRNEHGYHMVVRNAWWWVHTTSAYGGSLALAVAAASGAMYVYVSRRLRSKSPIGPQFGSLERMEHITMLAVTLGFALLTVGMITGGVQMFAEGKHTPMAKVILAVSVWVVYAIVLHAPINPSFRGRKVAVLSVVGFVLLLGVLLTVLLVPMGAS
jgi:ABC-type uncharacterized transport system permease subunit